MFPLAALQQLQARPAADLSVLGTLSNAQWTMVGLAAVGCQQPYGP
ncbi:hypothetical protein [Streptomyces kaniharaensis]|nr:hypothetical protein [Streptomyces kaniharaensis]